LTLGNLIHSGYGGKLGHLESFFLFRSIRRHPSRGVLDRSGYSSQAGITVEAQQGWLPCPPFLDPLKNQLSIVAKGVET
jgi:hypothetical protein